MIKTLMNVFQDCFLMQDQDERSGVSLCTASSAAIGERSAPVFPVVLEEKLFAASDFSASASAIVLAADRGPGTEIGSEVVNVS